MVILCQIKLYEKNTEVQNNGKKTIWKIMSIIMSVKDY